MVSILYVQTMCNPAFRLDKLEQYFVIYEN